MKRIRTTSKYIKSSISYDWWKYLLISIILCVLCFFSLSMKLKLRRYEQLQIFLTAEVSDTNIVDELQNEFKKEGIEEITLFTASETSSYLQIQLEVNGFGDSDLLLLPEDVLKDKEELIKTALLFNDEFVSNIKEQYPSSQIITYQNYSYALKIFDIDDNSYNSIFHFDKWLKLDKTYYLAIARNSQNIGKYGEKSSLEHDAAIKMMNYLLGRK